MNEAHIHLIMVHIPIVLVPLATALTAIGIWRHDRSVRSVGLGMFVLAGCCAGAAFLSGEGAEEAVEHLAGISESLIETHEDLATTALWLTVTLAVGSLLGLFGARVNLRIERFVMPAVLVLGVLSSGALVLTGQAGGRIRHPEAFDSAGGAGTTSETGGHQDHED